MRFSLRSSFLRTRFGRRILLLFLACAMLPLGTLTVMVLSETSDEMDRQSRHQLRRTAKAIGMAIIADVNRLTETSERLALAALTDGRALRELMTESDSLRLRGIVILAESGDTVKTWQPEAFADLAEEISRNDAKQMFFPLQRGAGRALALASTHRVGGRVLRVISVVDPDAFFGDTDVQGWLDSGMQSCVTRGGEVIWCSVARDLWTRVRVVGDGSVSVDGKPFVSAVWSGFAPLAAPGSRVDVVAFAETASALGDSAGFRRSLVLLAPISLVLVFLASHMQLRRSLRPLEELTRATQRVGTPNVAVRVDAGSDDEFGVLARSFNDMSSRIASHVALLSSTAAINDEALRAANVPELLPRLTAHVRTLLPGEYGLSLAARAEQARWTRRSVMTRSADWIDDELELGAAGLRGLVRGELVAGRFGGQDARPYMRAPSAQRGWEGPAVAIPLHAEQELVGILTILVPDGALATNSVLENVRAVASELALALNHTRLVGRLEQFNYGTLTALARTVDAKSPWTAGHSENVTHCALRLGEQLHLTSDDLDMLHRGGLLHDIGKIAVPGAILDKPGRLTDEEMQIVQSHPEVGARILAPIEAYEPIIPIVLYHHERFDGSGYPRGLRGDAIPSLARLVAVADVYDALVSDRPYRAGWLPERAVAHIREMAGAHFDPVMAQAFAVVEPALRPWYAEHQQRHVERRADPRPSQLTAV